MSGFGLGWFWVGFGLDFVVFGFYGCIWVGNLLWAGLGIRTTVWPRACMRVFWFAFWVICSLYSSMSGEPVGFGISGGLI